MSKEQSNHETASSGGNHAHEEHGVGHVMPLSILFGVGAALLFFTAITVWVTYVDLGRSGNLLIAMAIATVKAGLVCAYFMHLRWDRPFNSLVFVSSILFVALFISITLLDKAEYEADIEEMYLLEGK